MVIRVTVFLHAVLNGQMTNGLSIELVIKKSEV